MNTIFPAQFVGEAVIIDGVLDVGGCKVEGITYGFNPASVYVRHAIGEDGVSVAHVLVEIVGDAFAQEQLEAQNADEVF